MAGVTLWLPLCRIWAILFLSIFIGYAAGPKSNCRNSGTPLTIKQNKVQHGELCPVYSDVKIIALCRKAFSCCGCDDVPALNRETCQLYCLFVCLFIVLLSAFLNTLTKKVMLSVHTSLASSLFLMRCSVCTSQSRGGVQGSAQTRKQGESVTSTGLVGVRTTDLCSLWKCIAWLRWGSSWRF